jgi:hypothetical protein
MKVSELKEVLKNSKSESEWYQKNWSEEALKRNEEDVVIVVREPVSTLGALPTVEVECAGFGFDWDNNRLLLHPKVELTKYKTADSLSALSIAFVREVSQERTAKGRPTKLAKKAQALLESI